MWRLNHWPAAAFSALLVAFLVLAQTTAAEPDPDQTAAEVDRLLASEVPGSGAVPLAGDETFLRRAFLDLIGQPPTADDVLAFCFTSGADKRTQLIDSLLSDESFGENWGRYWRDVILYRRSDERALIVTDALESHLTEQLNGNTSWDQIASSFVTASGDARERGDTGLIVAQFGTPEDVVAEISRIFMGIQIQCAQCHDHPTDRWRREQFHELAAFFPRVAVRPSRDGDQRSFVVSVNDRPFVPRRANNNNRYAGTPEHFMPDLEDPASPGTRMQPVFFVSEQEVPLGTRDADRRGQLAEWITSPENPWFAKALVNRVWSELVGEGFYEPIDDMGPDRECAAPRTLDYLAEAFVASGYDLKWLYRAVMATEAYQRESRSRRNYAEEPFQANCLQRLRGDQLFDALTAALDIQDRLPQAAGRSGPYGRRGSPRTLFNLGFGYDPSEPREEVQSSIPQALAMMNSPFINQAINARRPDGLGAILLKQPDNEDALVSLYLETLSRGPSPAELRTCLSYIRDVGQRNEAFEDIQWALINSTEFLHRK